MDKITPGYAAWERDSPKRDCLRKKAITPTKDAAKHINIDPSVGALKTGSVK
jgi:hypothetical protein